MTDRAAPGRPLRYAGYRSYAYLEPGRDYRVFDLASETDRVPPFTVEVSDAEAKLLKGMPSRVRVFSSTQRIERSSSTTHTGFIFCWLIF